MSSLLVNFHHYLSLTLHYLSLLLVGCSSHPSTSVHPLCISVRNFLFLTCSTRTRTLCLPQTTPHVITTSHTQGNHRLPHHPTTIFPFQTTIITTNQPPQSLWHQCTQPPIPIKDPPNPTGTHDPQHSNLGHLSHTSQGPFGTTVNHAPSLFIHKRIPST